MNKRYCLALDLHNDPTLIAEYEAHHQKVWPEVLQSIREAGIVQLEIYRTGSRLCMIMEVDETFSFEKKQQADQQNEIVQAWEKLMWKYQKAIPTAARGEKWLLMDLVFKLV